MGNPESSPRVAVLQNIQDSCPAAGDITARIVSLVLASCPAASVDVFKPIEGEKFPHLMGMDLVIWNFTYAEKMNSMDLVVFSRTIKDNKNHCFP